jgi:hypothetical protein
MRILYQVIKRASRGAEAQPLARPRLARKQPSVTTMEPRDPNTPAYYGSTRFICHTPSYHVPPNQDLPKHTSSNRILPLRGQQDSETAFVAIFLKQTVQNFTKYLNISIEN